LPPIEKFIENAIKNWFYESYVCPISIVNSIEDTQEVTGHFLQMSHDLNTMMGCAAVEWIYYTENRLRVYNFRMTCNYYQSPWYYEPLYTTGIPCDGCENCSFDDEVTAGLCILNPEDLKGKSNFN
jgi:hypothetical protein